MNAPEVELIEHAGPAPQVRQGQRAPTCEQPVNGGAAEQAAAKRSTQPICSPVLLHLLAMHHVLHLPLFHFLLADVLHDHLQGQRHSSTLDRSARGAYQNSDPESDNKDGGTYLEMLLMHVFATVANQARPRVQSAAGDAPAHDPATEGLLALHPTKVLFDCSGDATHRLRLHPQHTLQTQSNINVRVRHVGACKSNP